MADAGIADATWRLEVILQIGKVPNSLLSELVVNKMKSGNSRVLLPAGIGEDFGVIDFGGECCIVSGDPVTGAVEHAGTIAVHVACNDIATSGASPVAILTTLLLPPGATEAELGALADDIAGAAASLGVSVIGGHTEVTDAVTRVVVSVTAIGAAKRGEYITTGGAKAGDSLIMTKSAGIEGTAIIAMERRGELEKRFGAEFAGRAARLSGSLSVVKEGIIAGGFGAHAMHDVTEGGVYGAVWEMAEASGKGVTVYRGDIPVLGETLEICAYFGIDAYRLVSSGSMLIATGDPGGLVALLGGSGVPAARIAVFTDNPAERFIKCGGTLEKLGEPGPDELYKVAGQGAGG